MYARAMYKLDINDKVIQTGGFADKSTEKEQEVFLVSPLPLLRLARAERSLLVAICP